MSDVSLHDIAPRLARARDQWIDHRRREAAWNIAHGHRVLAAERLVAHRDLQLVRAYATGSGDYIKRRRRKLKAAQRSLAELLREEFPG